MKKAENKTKTLPLPPPPSPRISREYHFFYIIQENLHVNTIGQSIETILRKTSLKTWFKLNSKKKFLYLHVLNQHLDNNNNNKVGNDNDNNDDDDNDNDNDNKDKYKYNKNKLQSSKKSFVNFEDGIIYFYDNLHDYLIIMNNVRDKNVFYCNEYFNLENLRTFKTLHNSLKDCSFMIGFEKVPIYNLIDRIIFSDLMEIEENKDTKTQSYYSSLIFPTVVNGKNYATYNLNDPLLNEIYKMYHGMDVLDKNCIKLNDYQLFEGIFKKTILNGDNKKFNDIIHELLNEDEDEDEDEKELEENNNNDINKNNDVDFLNQINKNGIDSKMGMFYHVPIFVKSQEQDHYTKEVMNNNYNFLTFNPLYYIPQNELIFYLDKSCKTEFAKKNLLKFIFKSWKKKYLKKTEINKWELKDEIIFTSSKIEENSKDNVIYSSLILSHDVYQPLLQQKTKSLLYSSIIYILFILIQFYIFNWWFLITFIPNLCHFLYIALAFYNNSSSGGGSTSNISNKSKTSIQLERQFVGLNTKKQVLWIFGHMHVTSLTNNMLLYNLILRKALSLPLDILFLFYLSLPNGIRNIILFVLYGIMLLVNVRILPRVSILPFSSKFTANYNHYHPHNNGFYYNNEQNYQFQLQ